MAAESLKEKRERRRQLRQAAASGQPTPAARRALAADARSRAMPTDADGEAPVRREGNALVRTLANIRDYFAGVRTELGKVVWPDREEAIRLTWIVIAVTVAAGIALGLISALFTELFTLGLANPWLVVGVFVGMVALGFAVFTLRQRRSPY